MIGITVAMHKSEKRENGFELINDFIDSLYKYCKRKFMLYLFDNQSDEDYSVPNYLNINYEYIENQLLRGLELVGNDGIMKAIKDGCDIIIHMNDDNLVNETINDFVDIIRNHKHNKVSLYAPLTNKPLSVKSNTYGLKPGKGLVEVTNVKGGAGVLNGPVLAFTKDFYEKFKLPSGKLWHPRHPWGGGEGYLRRRITPHGGRFFIIKDCWLFHHKIGGWRQLPNAFPNKNEGKKKTKNNIRRKRITKR